MTRAGRKGLFLKQLCIRKIQKFEVHMPLCDNLTIAKRYILHISTAGMAGRGRYNHDTETRLDIGDPYLDISRNLDFQRVNFSTGRNFSVSMQICWKVTASILIFYLFIALCFLGGVSVFAHDKTSLLQK